MVTGRLIYEWRMNTSQLQNVMSQSNEGNEQDEEEEEIDRVPKPKYFDDRSF